MTSYDEQQIARLIASLPPVPQGWAEAAYEIPQTQVELGSIIERIERDEAFRASVQADIDRALTEAGVEPNEQLVERLRRRLVALERGDDPGAH